MVVSASLIEGDFSGSDLIVRGDGFIDVAVQYTAPYRERNSVMSLTFRCETDVTESAAAAATASGGAGVEVMPGARVRPGRTQASMTSAGVPLPVPGSGVAIAFEPKGFGNLLKTRVFGPVSSFQSKDVVYRRVNVKVYDAIPLDPPSAPATGPRRKIKTLSLNENLRPTALYRYKCGSGLIGGYKGSEEISKGSLALLLYGVQDGNATDKPSRFLVAGTPFKSYSEAIADPSVIGLIDTLSNPIVITSGTNNIILRPMVEVQGCFREVEIVQLEGISKVAGMRKEP